MTTDIISTIENIVSRLEDVDVILGNQNTVLQKMIIKFKQIDKEIEDLKK